MNANRDNVAGENVVNSQITDDNIFHFYLFILHFDFANLSR